MTRTANGRNELRSIIKKLKETAKQFRAFDGEAKIALAKGDTKEYERKLKKKVRLLFDLPDRLSHNISSIPDQKVQRQLIGELCGFTSAARAALAGGTFGLGVLLIDQGSKTGDDNNLEKLIKLLENKQR